MKRLLLGLLLMAAASLATACGSDSNDEELSPTVEPASPSPTTALTASQVITTTQELPVEYRVDRPDGTYELKPSTMSARVGVFCADDPVWSAQEGQGEWRVVAECKKEEAGTPAAFGFELLHFEWIYYTDLRRIMPVSQPAHDAQYPYPQPSPFPIGTPFSVPVPSATP